MANLTQTLTDSIRFFSPATTFGSPMKWGTDLWGNNLGSSGNFDVPTNAKTSNQDQLTFADLLSVPLMINLTGDTISFIQGPSQSETLSDSSQKWFLVLSGGVTNGENSFIPTYVNQSNPSGSWSLQTNSSTSWVTG